MDESAPKRRRVSPRLSSQRDGDSDNNDSTTPPGPPPPRSRIPRRPSFASPTRASLARSNPDLLRQRSRSLSPTKGGSGNPSTQAPQDAVGDEPAAQAGGQAERFLERGATRPRSDISGSTAVESQNLGSPARRIPASRLSGALATRPRRSGGLPNPRPLPDPGPDDEEINPFAGRVLNRTPPTGVIPARAPPPQPEPDEEPELPPTPTQKGQDDPVVTTPPLGIHDTPSRRRRRISSPSKSSPLKQPPLRPPEFTQTTKDPFKKAMQRPVRERSPSRLARKTQSTKGPSGTHEARGIPVPDPNSDLRQTRDALQAEIAKLEADLEFATVENERVRKTRSLRSDAQPLSTSRREQLVDLLRRHLVRPEKEAKPDAAQEWLDLAMNPISWLSFGSLGQTSVFSSTEEEEDLPPPTSHHPIALSATDELPYLQAFTPFEFSGATTMLPRESDSEPLLRKHSIVIRSAHPAGLFMAKIEMTVDTEKLQITELIVPRLDPAAVAEVGPFVQKVTQGGSNTHMNRNVTIVTWAMAEWYRIAIERANVWYTLESELGDKEKLVQSVAKIRTRRKKRRRKADDEDDSQEAAAENTHAENLPRSALLRHLGKTAYEIPIPDAVKEEASCLRIHWKIEFDWTGEAQSKVGLMIGMPGKWHRGDKRGSLAAASKVFEKLVQGNEGPMTAVRTVVALLAGDALS
ncbi:hypothetical protein CGRA01v4_13870 [Colletotrichum graminicola]|uniref:Uncharacterized protein n=1 Tax=Colletotrichum graminicola (strain M1.001 / M2 / FGSC 10212) TaxID=645133 RepID=E3QUG4_COLGM|nr:uncharacterized protein GLRG_09646 [Colletotrichum graminicola M1.001]EFQ34502.1 hypothetical protein GLRG_09646 [Colletotrichum graminicola M1.001]WDK22580.1 hypothetical protein CGRA01v4_13870 [Colletotrichum graminicola]